MHAPIKIGNHKLLKLMANLHLYEKLLFDQVVVKSHFEIN